MPWSSIDQQCKEPRVSPCHAPLEEPRQALRGVCLGILLSLPCWGILIWLLF